MESTDFSDEPEIRADEAARWRAVLSTAVDAIITIDAQGRIQSINPATTRMFGYQERELLGQNISLLMPQPYRDEHDGYIRRYLVTGQASIIGVGRQVSGRRRDGQEFPAHLAVSEFTVRGERHFAGIIRDLTELDAVQRQLLQSERLAAIGQMVTGLAHESRNALQRAQACLDMLALDLQDQAEQLELARKARTALQDLHRLYEEVRGYAAPIHLEFRDCDLRSIWRREWDNLTAARRGKAIELDDSEVSSVCQCSCDPHRMEQVFRNILENAIHACGDRGTLRICLEPVVRNSAPEVRVRLIDDGAGLSDLAARQIFEPFFTTKQKGTGLGMAIVHRIISAHRGTITAQPAEPVGTEISFTIPLCPQPAPPA